MTLGLAFTCLCCSGSTNMYCCPAHVVRVEQLDSDTCVAVVDFSSQETWDVARRELSRSHSAPVEFDDIAKQARLVVESVQVQVRVLPDQIGDVQVVVTASGSGDIARSVLGELLKGFEAGRIGG